MDLSWAATLENEKDWLWDHARANPTVLALVHQIGRVAPAWVDEWVHVKVVA
jgi:hypothetical protein